ncbi:hypothetical protein V496_06558 [Pseudogymnoascus sp. VKM F-4515 (FW-2607)]|nr:hypothetical protein V496_06558 [Pseudogymnoascus sp. VKM F-4515 (FW-2607)]KFY96176.1 hypothetical protein V498_02834 [Pseudogymnoascus sp. VKM F-4517 (FW-2822)]
MDKGHPCQYRHDAQEGDDILGKQLFGADIAPRNAEDDDGYGEHGAPPAHDHRGLVVVEGARRRRRRPERRHGHGLAGGVGVICPPASTGRQAGGEGGRRRGLWRTMLA